MKRKIFISIFLTAVAVLLTASALSTAVMYTRMSEESMLEVRDVADSVASILNASQNDTEILTAFAENARSRITLIAADGRVIYDNDADETAMDNHLDRPEVAQALSSGSGEVVRNSETIGKRTFYRAVRLNDGSVLRVAATGSSFFGLLGGWLPWTLLIAALVCFAALITALTLADSLTRPINTINIEDPLSNNVYDELSPLLTRLEAQNGRIREQIRELTANKREFECITDGMQEGIVIFSAECGVTLKFVPASEPLTVSGIKQVIYEMVYNLTDNAIRYNRAGGSAELTAQRRDERIVLKVSDTGIGIAPEHRTRVFERFYSVDKSRSKANGGTGLGLSIVKHGAMLHDAEVSLDSVPGNGTCVTVSFPAAHKQ